MNRYPIYIISKGRWQRPLTANALDAIGANWRIVVEPQERAAYAAALPRACILTLPFSNLGQGSIPARNWVWEHATQEGHARHWILDDNIRRFYRLHQNKKYAFTNAIAFQAIEDFTDRYVNLPMSGMNYELLAPARNKNTPITWNTRIYSCILLSNSVPHRWRGRYNEDTDLSLRFLKDGFCTALFNAFLCDKVATLTMKGGNTDTLYRQDEAFDGRLEMARSLQRQHPDMVKITRKWGRWQHQVNYRPFKGNKLIRRAGVVIPEGVNDYGMRLVKIEPKAAARTADGPSRKARPTTSGGASPRPRSGPAAPHNPPPED
jgi:hypothetical protein